MATGIAWALGLVALLLLQLRGDWAWYVDLHRALRDAGVPDWLRAEDGFLLRLLLVGVAALLAARILRTSAPRVLWLQRPAAGWSRVAMFSAAPILLGGMVLGLSRGSSLADIAFIELWRGSVRAPVIEELLCRGLLVGTVALAFGPRAGVTVCAAIGSALLFGFVHIPWSWAGLSAGWPTLVVTGVGGLWFAWLMLRWHSLWLPIWLHAAMNLGWFLCQAKGGAGGGGLIENLLRVATITLATVGTLRNTSRS